jgi:hypothetical protein
MWQAVNQSLNAGFNYSNRSGSDSGVRDLAVGYASAVAVSCGVAVGLGQVVKRAVNLSPARVRLCRERCRSSRLRRRV